MSTSKKALRRNGNLSPNDSGTAMLGASGVSARQEADMGLGKKLKDAIGKQKQGAIATEWLHRWIETGGREFSPDTVETRLSACVNEKHDGVVFFFEERARAALLLDVLEVPDDHRQPILKDAEDLLATASDRPARVVIDLGRWDSQRDAVEALSVAVEEQVLRAADLWPVVLVVTTPQYRWLPRTIEERDGRLRIEQCPDSSASEARARVLAGTAALVISPWRHEPFELWAAFTWRKEGGVTLSPPDAITAFARDGRLAPLTCGAPTLASLGVEPAPPPLVLPTDGVDLHRLMLALASPSGAAELKKQAPVRMAMAHALGIDAAATERELIEHDIAGLVARVGVAFDSKAGAKGRDELLERAKRRAVDARAFLVGDEVHVVGPPESIDAETQRHPRLRLHPIERRLPAIVRLREAASSLTADDLLDDPLLVRLIRELDPTGVQSVAFAHARAALFRAGVIASSASKPARDWRAALAVVVAGDPPPTRLRVQAHECVVMPSSLIARGTATDLGDLAFLPCTLPMLLSSDEQLVAPDDDRKWSQEIPLDVEAWQDHLESWVASPPAEWNWNAPRATAVTCPWIADELMAIGASTWLALRRAVAAPEAVVRPDGAVQVHVGGGVCLVLDARIHERRDRSVDLRAALSCTASRRGRAYGLVELHGLTRHTTLSPHSTRYEPGYELPTGFHVSGLGFAFDAHFAFAPWLDDGSSLRHRAPIRRLLADEEAQRQADEDDD